MSHNTQLPNFLPQIMALVQEHLDRWEKCEVEHQPQYEAELQRLESQIVGFSKSLANPDISPLLRSRVEADFAEALEQQNELNAQIAERDTRQQLASDLVCEEDILDRMNRLAEVLTENNPTLGNLELSLHIDRINCFEDGRVSVRTCKLGGVYDAVDLLAGAAGPVSQPSRPPDGEGVHVANPRRRGRRKFYDHERGSVDDRAMADFAADPHRFAGLPESFFWTDEFIVPEKKLWWELHAREVWDFCHSVPKKSKAAASRHFKKSIPTIRLAIRRAEEEMAKGGDLKSSAV